MKGLIIEQDVSEGVIAWVHGMTFKIQRLLIPEVNNLAVTIHQGQLYVFEGFEDQDYRLVREVDVPEETVSRLEEFTRLRDDV